MMLRCFGQLCPELSACISQLVCGQSCSELLVVGSTERDHRQNHVIAGLSQPRHGRNAKIRRWWLSETRLFQGCYLGVNVERLLEMHDIPDLRRREAISKLRHWCTADTGHDSFENMLAVVTERYAAMHAGGQCEVSGMHRITPSVAKALCYHTVAMTFS